MRFSQDSWTWLWWDICPSYLYFDCNSCFFLMDYLSWMSGYVYRLRRALCGFKKLHSPIIPSFSILSLIKMASFSPNAHDPALLFISRCGCVLLLFYTSMVCWLRAMIQSTFLKSRSNLVSKNVWFGSSEFLWIEVLHSAKGYFTLGPNTYMILSLVSSISRHTYGSSLAASSHSWDTSWGSPRYWHIVGVYLTVIQTYI